jgi:hypothetical protein
MQGGMRVCVVMWKRFDDKLGASRHSASQWPIVSNVDVDEVLRGKVRWRLADQSIRSPESSVCHGKQFI